MPRRTSASSRSTSAAPRWCAPRPRTTRASPSSPRRRGTPTCSPRSRPAASPWSSGRRLAAEAFAHTATYDVAVASYLGNVVAAERRRDRLPGLARRDLGARGRCCATARTRTSAPRSTQRARAVARARAGRAAARQGAMSYNNYVDADAARRAAYDHSEPARGDHQAREPVRHRDRRRHRRGAPQGPRLRPGVGVRRRDRHQPAGDGRDGRAGRRDLHRGRRRAGVRRRGAGAAAARRRTCGCSWLRRPRAHGGAEIRPVVGRRADAGRRPRSTPPATTRRAGRSASGDGRSTRTTLRRPGVRLAGLPLGEVQRDPAGQGRRVGRRRHGPGQPGRLRTLAVSRAGGTAPRARSPRRTRSSRSPTGSRCWRRPGSARSSSRAARCATRRSSTPREAPASRCTSPAPATSSTDG